MALRTLVPIVTLDSRTRPSDTARSPLEAAAAPHRARRLDPRVYQIAALGSLLLYGVGQLGFDVKIQTLLLVLGAALATQHACSKLWKLPTFEPRSALISGLSLCLLLRTNDPRWAVLATVITVASKFVLRVDGKHIFNPTNFGLAVAMLLTDRVWVSPGQWGSAAFFGFLLVCAGGMVVHRSARSDVTWSFLLFYAAVLVGRSLWLGEPLGIPLHRLQSGALLLFAFFMISDPRTTPDARAGRVLYALLVALGAGFVHFVLFENNGLLWSLVACAPLVPLLNRILPGTRYEWSGTRRARAPHALKHRGHEPIPPPHGATVGAWMTGLCKEPTETGSSSMKRNVATLILGCLFTGLTPVGASAFCGFYVSKADTKLFNKASQVVLVRDDDRTVITMVNDFKGDPREFAVVIPVPTFIEREQIHVTNQAIVDHLDAYTAPRLVEYFDHDPCQIWALQKSAMRARDAIGESEARRERSLGVSVEARYTVGEYDIVILSAKQSDGLQTWLRENGYRIPKGASKVLGSYIKQGTRFFVARVNLEEQSALGFTYLRPLQIAFESPKFMLPIRLGTVNADGPQDLFVYALTRTGRVETTNYRTVKLPTGMDLPLFVEGDFSNFYRDMFTKQVEKEHKRAVFLEYAWDMGWCDPCAADPLSIAELRELGAFWVHERSGPKNAARDVYVTRLHVRYDAEHFPEDLAFQETGDRTNFQGRYVLRRPWTGDAACSAAQDYRKALRERQMREAKQLASLTGWRLDDILGRIELADAAVDEPWWKTIWHHDR